MMKCKIMSDVVLHQGACGGLLSWYAAVPGHPARRVGYVHDTSREEAVHRAVVIAERADAWAALEAQMRDQYPGQQLYRGVAGQARDVEWPAWCETGIEYLYILKPRRAHGKYQIAAAETCGE